VNVIWQMIHMDRIFGYLICLLFLEFSVYPVPIHHLFLLWGVIVFVSLHCIPCNDFKFCPLPLNWGVTSRVSETHQKGREGWVWPEWPHPLSFSCSVARGRRDPDWPRPGCVASRPRMLWAVLVSIVSTCIDTVSYTRRLKLSGHLMNSENLAVLLISPGPI